MCREKRQDLAGEPRTLVHLLVARMRVAGVRGSADSGVPGAAEIHGIRILPGVGFFQPGGDAPPPESSSGDGFSTRVARAPLRQPHARVRSLYLLQRVREMHPVWGKGGERLAQSMAPADSSGALQSLQRVREMSALSRKGNSRSQALVRNVGTAFEPQQLNPRTLWYISSSEGCVFTVVVSGETCLANRCARNRSRDTR